MSLSDQAIGTRTGIFNETAACQDNTPEYMYLTVLIIYFILYVADVAPEQPEYTTAVVIRAYPDA